MLIKNLSLSNFRNYTEETFTFCEGLNILFGRNAQGKTNCAEAVFYLCTGTSLRTRRDRQLIQTGKDCARISAEAETRYGKVTLAAEIRENGRALYVNGCRLTRAADLFGNINSVFFSPSELRLIQDGPDQRRRFLNMSISQTSGAYYTALLRYNKILEQRNNLLKNRDVSLILETLPVWDEQLCKYAAVIMRARRDYLAMLAPFAREAQLFLTDGEEELILSSNRKNEGEESELAERLRRELEREYERDIRLGFTGSGPHRDDIDFTVNGMDAKQFASQGQTRTIALAVKLAELEIFKTLSGEYPVLILDDVMSELDLPRRKKLLGKIEGIQTILTCTHAERVLYGKTAHKIKIQDGHIL